MGLQRQSKGFVVDAWVKLLKNIEKPGSRHGTSLVQNLKGQIVKITRRGEIIVRFDGQEGSTEKIKQIDVGRTLKLCRLASVDYKVNDKVQVQYPWPYVKNRTRFYPGTITNLTGAIFVMRDDGSGEEREILVRWAHKDERIVRRRRTAPKQQRQSERCKDNGFKTGDRVVAKRSENGSYIYDGTVRSMCAQKNEAHVRMDLSKKSHWLPVGWLKKVKHDDEKFDPGFTSGGRVKATKPVRRYNDTRIRDHIQQSARRTWRDRINDAITETLRFNPNFPERQRDVKSSLDTRYGSSNRSYHRDRTSGALRKGQRVTVREPFYDDDLRIEAGWIGTVVGEPSSRGAGIKFKTTFGAYETLFVKTKDIPKLQVESEGLISSMGSTVSSVGKSFGKSLGII